jgi:Protein of unknown function (DUF2924)
MSQGQHYGGTGENLSLQRSSSQAEKLDLTIAGLDNLDADQLRLQWRNHLGGTAPAHLPRWLLLRVLAYRVQAAALGDLNKTTVRSIRAWQRDAIDFAGSPFKKRKPRTRDGIGLNPGALLVREWRGKLERVMVLDRGFVWNGRTFGSLSQVAKAVTGTSWNGHRFFGLQSAKGQGSKRREVNPGSDEHRQPDFDHPKDFGQAEFKGDRRGASKGIGGGQSDRPVAKARCPGGRLTRCRVSIPESKLPVPAEGERHQNLAEGSL